jgi:hypothetical protein
MNELKSTRLVLNAIVLSLLGACAGGGGGGGGGMIVSPPPPPPPPSPPVFPPLAPPHADGDFPGTGSGEFTANWGVGGINAQIAWQNGATGEGVLVGVIDTGIHPEHPELTGRISPNSIDIRPSRNTLVSNETHGSELSSLIAGNYNGAQTVGVAFDATILAIRADNSSGSFESTDLANAIDYARQQGVDVINLSLGSPSPTAANVEQAIRNATAAGIIIVVSAGNDGDSGATHPNYPGFLAIDPLVSNGLIMIAGGLNPNGTVNPASNPPGIADDWYLTAPGWQIIVPDYGPVGPVPGFQSCGASAGLAANLCRIQGTSYASPHVAGAVALVMDAFPGLTPTQVVDLLLTTADDTGAPGTDAVNGRGRLNVGRAFQPVGPLSVPLLTMSSAQELDPGVTLGGVGAAFGDGMSINTTAWTVAGFDHYNRTFPVNLADNWLSAAAGPSGLAQAPLLWRTAHGEHGARMQIAFGGETLPDSYRGPIDRDDFEQAPARIDADIAPGLTASFAAHGARTMYDGGAGAVGLLDFVNADLSLRLTHQLGDGLSFSLLSESGVAPATPFLAPSDRNASAARASFDRRAFGLDLTVGRVDEESGLLGLAWSPDFGATPAGETRFTAIAARADIAPGVEVAVNAEFGVAELGQGGWLDVSSPLRTTAFSLETTFAMTPAWLANGDGALSLSVSQPLRIEGGTLSFMAPAATKYGRQSLTYEERTFSPTPSGRELRFGLAYRYFAGETLSAFGEALFVLDPGHIDGAAPDTVLRFGVRAAH